MPTLSHQAAKRAFDRRLAGLDRPATVLFPHTTYHPTLTPNESLRLVWGFFWPHPASAPPTPPLHLHTTPDESF